MASNAGGGSGAGGAVAMLTPGSDVEVDGSALGGVVDLDVGQTLVLTLQTIGPGEYGEPELSAAIVAFDGEELAPLQNPGGPRQVYRFHGVAPGSAVISIAHTAQALPFTLTVHIP